MQKIRYQIALPNASMRDVEGYAVDGGVFALRYYRDLRKWRLDHLASGMSIYAAKDKAEVLELAAKLLPLADWPNISQDTPYTLLGTIHGVVLEFRRSHS